MADTVLTNTYLPAGPGGATLERESLRDVVEMVAIDDTPLFSNIRKTTASAIKEEWSEEDIGTVVAAPARNRGFVAAVQAAVTPVRLDNYLQLCAVEFGVSDSMERLDTVANNGSMAHQRLKWGIQLRRNLNKLLYAAQAKAGTEPTQMATPQAYITNYKGVATTPGTAPTGNGTNVATAGTGAKTTWDTIAPVDDVMEASQAKDGTPNVIYMNPKRKRQFSKLPDGSVAENRINMNAGNIGPFAFVGTVDLYLSDFGKLEIIVDVDAPTTSLLLLDHDYIDMPVLPGMDFKEDELGRRGSGQERMIQWEGTVRVLKRNAHAFINGFS